MTLVFSIFLGFSALAGVLNLLTVIARSRDLHYRILRDGDLKAPLEGDLISVIIPARNEERNIVQCLTALSAQSYKNIEILVINDRSEDRTGELLDDFLIHESRLQVIQGTPPPEGWMGKCNALHVGQQQATGEWLLFIDADVRLEPEAIRQTLAWAKKESAGVVSVFGKLILDSFWEWVVLPIVGGLILQNNDPRAVNDADSDKVMANGQFILVSRSAYEGFGGHESISGEILDDVGLARRAKKKGIVYRLAYGRQIFKCRMYRNFSELWEGWTKNLFPGLNYDMAKTVVIVILLFLVSVQPFMFLVLDLLYRTLFSVALISLWPTLLAATACILLYISYGIGLRSAGYRLGYVWSYPLGSFISVLLFINSAYSTKFKKRVTWKGRVYSKTGVRR